MQITILKDLHLRGIKCLELMEAAEKRAERLQAWAEDDSNPLNTTEEFHKTMNRVHSLEMAVDRIRSIYLNNQININQISSSNG